MQESTHSNVPPPVDADRIRRPLLAVALLGLAAVICASLGFWQLGRAEESRALAERIAHAAAEPPIRLRTSDDAGEALRYRSVEVEGRYVPDRQVLVDNIVHDGVVGYDVLTPFEPRGGGPWLIVNRGWVRADPDRRVLPDVPVDAEPRVVAGILDALPVPGLRLGDPPAGESRAPLTVISFPTIGDLEAILGRALFGYQLLLAEDEPDGYARDLPGPALTPERHLAYAAQWWLFGSIAGGAAAAVGWRAWRRRNA